MSSMEKATDNVPVLMILKSFGWEMRWPLHEMRNGYMMQSPEGERKVFIHKNGEAPGPDGRHRYGISYEYFGKVDYYVFWAWAEDYLLVVPASRLKEVLHDQPSPKLENGQWHVNVFFEWCGCRQWIQPVSKDDVPSARIELSEYAKRLPER